MGKKEQPERHSSPDPLFQVHQFSNKQTEMALRVASLDYLGTVAARLRKDAVTSQMDQRTIDRILKEVNVQSNTEHSEHTHILG